MANDRFDRKTVSQTPSRDSREAEDRPQTEDRVATDEERLEQYRLSVYSNALPVLPELPGYHVCYLTTTNPRDTIEGRMALGYQPIKPSDYPAGTFVTPIKGGVWDGFVGYHEMIAAKIPMKLYQMYMKESHFDAPNREEQKLVAQAEQMREQARAMGAHVQEGTGLAELRSNLKQAAFKTPMFE